MYTVHVTKFQGQLSSRKGALPAVTKYAIEGIEITKLPVSTCVIVRAAEAGHRGRPAAISK